MSSRSLSDDPQGRADLIESTASALVALVDRRAALAEEFDEARLMPPGDLRPIKVLALAETLDACDRDISTLLAEATNVLTSWSPRAR